MGACATDGNYSVEVPADENAFFVSVAVADLDLTRDGEALC